MMSAACSLAGSAEQFHEVLTSQTVKTSLTGTDASGDKTQVIAHCLLACNGETLDLL